MRDGVSTTNDSEAFLSRAGSFLGASPVEHSVIVTNARRGRPGDVWTTVVREGVVVAASMLTPPHPLQVSIGGPPQIGALAEHHHDAGRHLPGVGGMRAPAQVFADRWCELRGVAAREDKALGVFVCDEVAAPVGVPGKLRAARGHESGALVPWGRGFSEETGAVADDDPVTPRIADGRLQVWEVDGRIVSMAALSNREYGLSRVQLVYTPPELRGRGYASACVAALVEKDMRNGGRSMLYTDLANPTSNRIYQSIGFRRVGEAVRLLFH